MTASETFYDAEPRATVQWRSAGAPVDDAPPAGFAAALCDAKYAVKSAPPGTAIATDGRTRAARSAPADIAVFDVRGARNPVAAARRVAGRLNTPPPLAGRVILADADAAAAVRARLAKLGDVCFARSSAAPGDDLSAAYLVSRIRERLRLASMAEETGERLKSLVAYAGSAPALDLSASDRPRFLIAGEAGPPILSIMARLRAAGAEGVCVFTAAQAMRALENEAFDAALFAPSGERDVLLSLANALRRRRRRAPPILILDADNHALASACSRKGLAVLLKEHIDDDAANRLTAAAARGAGATGMAAFLKESFQRAAAHGDGEAGFFAHHGERLAARADETGRRLSVIALRADPADLDGDIAPLDVLSLARSVVRCEDACARIAPGLFGVIAPGVRRDDAERIARRLEGVARSLVSVAEDEDAVAAAAAARAPGEAFSETLFRLLRELRREPNIEARDHRPAQNGEGLGPFSPI